MGSSCSSKSIITQCNCETEIAEEQSINTEQYKLNATFITHLDLQYPTTINLKQINETQSNEPKQLKTDSSQLSQQTFKKGILKNKNVHYQQEMLLLSRSIKESDDTHGCQKLIEYLKARKQTSY